MPCVFVFAGLTALSVGCGIVPSGDAEASLAASFRALASANSMTPNGLSTNGLGTNGLGTNGLSTNGLGTNGLGSSQFSAWFGSQPPAFSDMVMRYLVACAYAPGASLQYTYGRVTYRWHGRLGLAPIWASGLPATETEQQLISVCLAAHVNKFGIQMEISLRGTDALGLAIPVTSEEKTTFNRREAAFFGNLFTDEGVYVCNDSAHLNTRESSTRACGLSSQIAGKSKECPPMIHAGSCADVCTWDRSKGYHTSCGLNGKSYRPLSTSIKQEDVYLCGDGICQLSESCDNTKGRGNSYDNCEADCGECGT